VCSAIDKITRKKQWENATLQFLVYHGVLHWLKDQSDKVLVCVRIAVMQQRKNPCICEEHYRGSDCRLFVELVHEKMMYTFALLYVKCIAYELTLFFTAVYKKVALVLTVYTDGTIKEEKAKFMCF